MKTKKLLLYFSFFILNFSFAFGQSWTWGAAGYDVGVKASAYCSSVASDMSGNAYTTGFYSGQLTLGSHILYNNYTNGIFLAKYDANGNVLWVVQPGDSLSDSYTTSITVDASGNSIITGEFNGTINFGNYTLSSVYYNNTFFIAKYDPSGNVLWAQGSNYQSASSYAEGYSVTTDKNNNIYVGGTFSDTIKIGNYVLTSWAQYTYAYAPFLAKFDANGNVLWAKTTSSINTGNTSTVAVTADNKGNAYLTGNFADVVTFGSYHLVSLNVPSAFLVKYSGSGNVLWAKQSDNVTLLGSTASATSVITDMSNNIYI
jgi:hypothetical protein